jgi:hypothetical protein
VEPTAVFIGPFSSAALAGGLGKLLSESGYFRVFFLDDPLALPPLHGGEPSVLLLEGSDPTSCHRYLTEPWISLVVLIDTAAAHAFVGMDNSGWQQVAETLRAAITGQTVSDAIPGSLEGVRILDASQISAENGRTGSPDNLATLASWVETLLAVHLDQRGIDGGPGVAGWSVSPHDAYRMLGQGSHGQQDLSGQLRTLEASLFASGDGLPPKLEHIRQTFSLSPGDLKLLCLILAPEIDGRYATAIGVLQDDLTRRRPGMTLLAELVAEEMFTTWHLRRKLNGPDSLVAKGLVRSEAQGLAVDAGLLPSPAIVAYMLSGSPETAAATIEAEMRSPSNSTPALSPAEDQLAGQIRWLDTDAGAVHVSGGERTKQWFSRLAGSSGASVLVGDFQSTGTTTDRASMAGDWSVLSRLLGSALLLLGTDTLNTAELREIASLVLHPAKAGPLVAVDSNMPHPLPGSLWTLHAPEATAAQRACWWTDAARQEGLPLAPGDAERLAATECITADKVVEVIAMAVRMATAGLAGSIMELVQQCARDITRGQLPPGVRRAELVYGWDDIVVGDENRALLESVAQHVLYQGRVMEDWGFSARVPYGGGLAALFSGPSGTGKTMAAQIIAKDLGVDLLHVDLSKTVSKYIGETEKNLDRVFEAAEDTGAVLLFDEADAIFGRRTQVKDAHDRHANVEVAYLLQRLESFQGLTILTSNLKQNIDSSFVRRLRFVIDFALPTAIERQRIWEKAFPEGVISEAGRQTTTTLSQLSITGASIQNVALHAAYLAAPHGGPVGAEELLTATRRELMKIGMRSAVSNLEDLVPVAVGVQEPQHWTVP